MCVCFYSDFWVFCVDHFFRCIPYRYKMMTDENSLEGEENLQVLLISSQKGKGMLFPKVCSV